MKTREWKTMRQIAEWEMESRHNWLGSLNVILILDVIEILPSGFVSWIFQLRVTVTVLFWCIYAVCI